MGKYKHLLEVTFTCNATLPMINQCHVKLITGDQKTERKKWNALVELQRFAPTTKWKCLDFFVVFTSPFSLLFTSELDIYDGIFFSIFFCDVHYICYVFLLLKLR